MSELFIDLSKLRHNFITLKNKLRPNTKMIAVVKANAYGSGSIEIAKELVRLGADYLAVAYTPEGIRLREAGISLPIMVFYPQPENYGEIIDAKLDAVVYQIDQFEILRQLVLQKHVSSVGIHLKFNSGLNRIGLSEEELLHFLSVKEQFPFWIKSIYSHLGASEEPKPHAFTSSQIDRFNSLQTAVVPYFDKLPLFHLINTSGIFNYPEFQFDAVRTGIGLYGFANQPQWDAQLEPIAELSSPIMQIHYIEKGESVGYNLGWIAKKPSKVAILPIGHADGIARHYGHGKGKVIIDKQVAPIIGNVCMDMLMVDVTEIECSINQKAIFFNQRHTASNFAQDGGTISYELLSGLSSRIKLKIR